MESVFAKLPKLDKLTTNFSSKYNVSKTVVTVALISIAVLLIFITKLGCLFVDLIGFYPLLMTVQAVEKRTKEDVNRWSVYWMIFIFTKFFEEVLFLLTGANFPFYFIFKIAFLLWCFSPISKGSQVIYDVIIKQYIVPRLVTEQENLEKKMK